MASNAKSFVNENGNDVIKGKAVESIESIINEVAADSVTMTEALGKAKSANMKASHGGIDKEEKEVKISAEHKKKEIPTPPSGYVGRRAPLNPFASPKLGKYRKGGGKAKIKDPRLNNNPLRGRLVVTFTTTALLLWVFFQEIIYSYVSFNGRCVSTVFYPKYDLKGGRMPFIQLVGYGSCEHNTGTDASMRRALGTAASDKGWPTDLVDGGEKYGRSDASWDSPNSRIYTQLGGLDTNLIRNYGEVFRIFWAMYMHAGFLHILINLICQIQILWMIEPDWGFWRTAVLFFVGGISGNLLSAVADPCSTTIGSSGAMYSLLGALVPYCIEYWKTIPRPCCILIFMVIVIMLGIITGFTGITDNFAHMGGCMAGILWGFATISSLAACDKCTLGERLALTAPFRWFIPKSTEIMLRKKAEIRRKKGIEHRLKALQNKKQVGGVRGKAMQQLKLRIDSEGRPPCKMAKREWFVRISCILALMAYWILGWIYLLDPVAYKSFQPSGQLKFSGWSFCECCEFKKSTDKYFVKTENLYWCFGGPGGKENIKFFCKV